MDFRHYLEKRKSHSLAYAAIFGCVAYIFALAPLNMAQAAPRAPAVSHSASAPPRCPYGISYSDGCPNAPVVGSFQRPDFSAYARQSGQKWRTAHPQPWNLAGVDYPVGYSTRLKLADPASVPLPTGCAYQATGSTQGGARVYCNRGASSPTIQGIDFSLHNCTVLEFTGNVTGTITVKNNNFRNGSNCAVAKGYLVKVDWGTVNFVFDFNQIDGNYPAYTAMLASSIITNMTAGAEIFQYNAFLNSPQRPISTITSGDVLAKYNYVDGWVMVPGREHGEFLEAVTRKNSTIENSTYSFNTMLTPSSAPAHEGTTTFYFATTPGGAVTFTNSTVDHNTVVTNLNKGTTTIAAALSELAWSLFNNVTVEDNYVDPSGALTCILNLGGAFRVAGSISGKTLTVASIGPGALYAGATFGGPGLTPEKIRPYASTDPHTGKPSTGTGGVGTYVLSGGNQSGSGTNWRTLDSPISGKLTESGNVNLRDGSAIKGIGFEREGAVCHGHV